MPRQYQTRQRSSSSHARNIIARLMSSTSLAMEGNCRYDGMHVPNESRSYACVEPQGVGASREASLERHGVRRMGCSAPGRIDENHAQLGERAWLSGRKKKDCTTPLTAITCRCRLSV